MRGDAGVLSCDKSLQLSSNQYMSRKYEYKRQDRRGSPRQTGNVLLSSKEWLNTAHYTVEIINPPKQAATDLLVTGIVYFPVPVSQKYVLLMKAETGRFISFYILYEHVLL